MNLENQLTPNLQLHLVKYHQAQKEIVVNEAIIMLEAFLNNSAIDFVDQLPSNDGAEPGDLYIVKNPELKENNSLFYFFNGWREIKPKIGCSFYVKSQANFYFFNGEEWIMR